MADASTVVDTMMKTGKIAMDVAKKVGAKVAQTTGATNEVAKDKGQGQ